MGQSAGNASATARLGTTALEVARATGIVGHFPPTFLFFLGGGSSFRLIYLFCWQQTTMQQLYYVFRICSGDIFNCQMVRSIQATCRCFSTFTMPTVRRSPKSVSNKAAWRNEGPPGWELPQSWFQKGICEVQQQNTLKHLRLAQLKFV